MGFWGSFGRGYFHAGGAKVQDDRGKDYYANDGSVGYGLGNATGSYGMAVRHGYERAGDIADAAGDVLDPDNWLLIGVGIITILVLTRD